MFLSVTSMVRIRNVSKSEIVTNMPLSGPMACQCPGCANNSFRFKRDESEIS